VIFGGNSPLNIYNSNSPLNPANIINDILQVLGPLVVPFLLVVGGVVLFPIVIDVVTEII